MRRRQIFAMQSNATNEREEHEIEEKTSEAPEEVLKAKACAKCGKILARGLYMHEKHCKG